MSPRYVFFFLFCLFFLLIIIYTGLHYTVATTPSLTGCHVASKPPQPHHTSLTGCHVTSLTPHPPLPLPHRLPRHEPTLTDSRARALGSTVTPDTSLTACHVTSHQPHHQQRRTQRKKGPMAPLAAPNNLNSGARDAFDASRALG